MLSDIAALSNKAQERNVHILKGAKRVTGEISALGLPIAGSREYGLRTGKQRPIDNRFAGAQPPPMLGVACNCITKLPGEKIFRHIGNEIYCLFPISGR
jgi:hypothetical protein